MPAFLGRRRALLAGLRPPPGFLALVDSDGALLLDADGALLVEPA